MHPTRGPGSGQGARPKESSDRRGGKKGGVDSGKASTSAASSSAALPEPGPLTGGRMHPAATLTSPEQGAGTSGAAGASNLAAPPAPKPPQKKGPATVMSGRAWSESKKPPAVAPKSQQATAWAKAKAAAADGTSKPKSGAAGEATKPKTGKPKKEAADRTPKPTDKTIPASLLKPKTVTVAPKKTSDGHGQPSSEASGATASGGALLPPERQPSPSWDEHGADGSCPYCEETESAESKRAALEKKFSSNIFKTGPSLTPGVKALDLSDRTGAVQRGRLWGEDMTQPQKATTREEGAAITTPMRPNLPWLKDYIPTPAGAANRKEMAKARAEAERKQLQQKEEFMAVFQPSNLRFSTRAGSHGRRHRGFVFYDEASDKYGILERRGDGEVLINPLCPAADICFLSFSQRGAAGAFMGEIKRELQRRGTDTHEGQNREEINRRAIREGVGQEPDEHTREILVIEYGPVGNLQSHYVLPGKTKREISSSVDQVILDAYKKLFEPKFRDT